MLIPAEKPRHNDEMGGRRYRKELGQPLHQPEHYRLEYAHSTTFPLGISWTHVLRGKRGLVLDCSRQWLSQPPERVRRLRNLCRSRNLAWLAARYGAATTRSDPRS